MNQKHEWLDQFGIVCGVIAGSDGTIQATEEQLANEVLRLSAALAVAEGERLTLARHVAQPYSPESPHRGEALRLAGRVVAENDLRALSVEARKIADDLPVPAGEEPKP